MSERQLHLFEPARPLLQRFGDAFFRAVPARPGVYIMCGDGQRVLYIGQSHNLRVRLASYKNARPDRAPSKVIRLVHAVRSIVWEECPTAQSAILKENQLLRTHRPRFNRMNTWPQAYRFVELQVQDNELTLALVSEAQNGGKMFGAFKGATVACAALMRQLWAALRRPGSPDEFPLRLCGLSSPRRFTFQLVVERWVASIERFLSGESDELLGRFAEAIPGESSAFLRNLHAADLEILGRFFLRGPLRNRQLRQSFDIPGRVIPQEQLDDWHVLGTIVADSGASNLVKSYP